MTFNSKSVLHGHNARPGEHAAHLDVFCALGFPTMLWKPVPEFLDYEVSEYGDLRRDGVALRPERTHGNGRKRFGLSKGGRLFRMKAHQLVARAFIGPPPFEDAEVCHNDGFHHNNHYSNLRWGTHASNVIDTAKHRLERKGRSGARLSAADHLAVEATKLLARNPPPRRRAPCAH